MWGLQLRTYEYKNPPVISTEEKLGTAPIGVFVCPGKEDRAPLPLLYSHNQSVGKISKPTNNAEWVYSIGWMNKGKKSLLFSRNKRTESIYWCKALIESTNKNFERISPLLFPHPLCFALPLLGCGPEFPVVGVFSGVIEAGVQETPKEFIWFGRVSLESL